MLIDSISDEGYLGVSLKEVASQGRHSIEVLERALKMIQSFDPCGVGAKSLRECLISSGSVFETRQSRAFRAFRQTPSSVATKNYKAIARSMRKSIDEVKEICDVILSMDPKPGLTYSDQKPTFVTPDVHVYKVG